MELVTAIYRELARQGFEQLPVYGMNAVVRAADEIIREVARPARLAGPGAGLEAWLNSDDRGRSSDAMARYLGGIRLHAAKPMMGPDNAPTPADPSDFGRCYRLLESAPELRPLLPRMAELSPAWAALVGAWDELEALYEEEFPTGQAPRLYARMQELHR